MSHLSVLMFNELTSYLAKQGIHGDKGGKMAEEIIQVIKKAMAKWALED